VKVAIAVDPVVKSEPLPLEKRRRALTGADWALEFIWLPDLDSNQGPAELNSAVSKETFLLTAPTRGRETGEAEADQSERTRFGDVDLFDVQRDCVKNGGPTARRGIVLGPCSL